MAGGVAVVGDSKLGTAVGEIRHADLFGPGLDDVVDAAERKGRKIFAVGIAGAILDGAGDAHVPFRFGEPRRDFGIVDGPVFAEAVEVGSLEVNVAEARRGTAPEVGFAASALAAFPIPVGAGRVRIGDVMLPDFAAVAVFGFFDGVVLLMWLVFEGERIAIAAKFQVVNLAMA